MKTEELGEMFGIFHGEKLQARKVEPQGNYVGTNCFNFILLHS